MTKISALPLQTDPNGRDILLIIDVPPNSGTPSGKSISLKVLFANIPANTAITGTFAVSGNTTFSGTNNAFTGTSTFVTARINNLTVQSNSIIIKNSLTPANSSVTAVSTGSIFYDSNYIYVKVANGVIKRSPLTSF